MTHRSMVALSPSGSARRWSLLLCAVALGFPLLAIAADTNLLGLRERIEAQRAIEAVRWERTAWPSQNPTPKPALEEVVSLEALKRKVEDSLAKSTLLLERYGYRVDFETLQRELQRIARDTRDPAQLRALFAALGNDPVRISETLARETLVSRLSDEYFSRDDRIHGPLRWKANHVLKTLRTPADMRVADGEYSELTVELASPEEQPPNVDPSIRRLNAEEWKSYLEQVGELNSLSAVRESDDDFSIVAVLERTPSRARLAGLRWKKLSLSEWWATHRAEYIGRYTTETYSSDYDVGVLPNIPDSACEPGTWTQTRSGVPVPLDGHASVWTGQRMLVWGGQAVVSGVGTDNSAAYDPATDTWSRLSRIGAPPPRYNHPAVWTGTRMIIWGGQTEISYSTSNTGGLYDPATDTWEAISLTGAPAARFGHAAIWSGTELVIWGGRLQTGGYTVTGGRYDPTTRIWRETSLVSAPTARSGFTAVWTGSRMVIWGGYDSADYTNTGALYNPATDSWSPTNTLSAPDPRAEHTAVWTGSRMIVWGGYHAFGASEAGGAYDPATDTWVPISVTNQPTIRTEHTAVWTGSRMVVWGGLELGSSFTENTGGIYNPTNNTWVATSLTNVPASRSRHTAVWTGSRMIVWGGQNYDDPGTLLSVFQNTGALFDPVLNRWTQSTSTSRDGAPTAREEHTAVWTGSSMIVWGGRVGSDERFPTATGARYDPATDSWSSTSMVGAPAVRTGHSAIWTGTRMIVWGGAWYTGSYTEDLNSGGSYDPITDIWVAVPNSPPSISGRRWHTAVWTGAEMIVYGGYFSTGQIGTGGRYNPTTQGWSPTSTSGSPATYHHSAVWSGTRMLVFGGWGYNGQTNTYVDRGSSYDPILDQWSELTRVGAPSPRGRHVGLWTGSQMLIWSGRDPNYRSLNSGARYVAATGEWLPITLTGAPYPREDALGLWTGDRMIVWGGGIPWGYDQLTASGGIYDPASDQWTAITSTGAPTQRVLPRGVWNGDQMIVWAGQLPYHTGGLYCPNICQDPDLDNVCSSVDNCPSVSNASQLDTDLDGSGDACDGDDDNDGVLDGADNCPLNANTSQADNDLDATGDVCDSDDDNDGALDAADNCPLIDNISQRDANADGEGDICDFNDAIVMFTSIGRPRVSWQNDPVFTTYNLYRGSLAMLRSTGAYTQVPGSNPYAGRFCGLTVQFQDDPLTPALSDAYYWLVTGKGGGGESALGDGDGVTRANPNPCP